MKKKSLSGILVILMVIALALTGCGQKGEQNAGVTGSGDGDGTSVSEPSEEPVDEPVVEDELASYSEPTNETSNEEPIQDADGNYVYLITVSGAQTEVKTCVNVWDYIEHDTPYDKVDLNQMLADLGWEVMEGGTGTGTYTYGNGDCVKITPWLGMSEFDLSSGEHRVYTYTVAPWKTPSLSEDITVDIICESIAEKPYVVMGTHDYVSFDEIVAYAHMIDAFRGGVDPNLAFEDNARIP